MNFFNWFKKKKYDIGVIRFGDSIIIPGREHFKEDDDIKTLEEYKQHYLSKLYRRKAITTPEFNSTELKEDMKRNVSLIVHLLLDNENFYLLSPEELLIQSGKLRIYYEEIARLEKTVITRLVALKEIEQSEQVPRHNRMALEEEINKLSTILQMYSYQKPAIAMELKNYFDVLSTRNLNDEETDKDVLKDRLNRLLFITDGIIDTSIIEGNLDIKSKIVLLEILCEKYTYQNKLEVEDIRSMQYMFAPTYSDDSDSFSISSEIEKKYLLFNEYGNKAITDEEVKNMYRLKYKQVLDVILDTEDTDRKYNFDEDYGYVYYKNFLEESIDCILRGKCEIFNNNFLDPIKAINLFKEYLQDEDQMIDIEEILKDRSKLKLIHTYESNLRYDYYLSKVRLKDFNNLYLYLNPELEIKFSPNAKMRGVLKYAPSRSVIYNHPIYKLFVLTINSREQFNSNSLNVDLIVHLFLDSENFYLLSPEELRIQLEKLRIYTEEITKLKKMAITRLKFLKEIEQNQKTPRHNRMALVKEINKLSAILQMYSQRECTLAIELKSYCDAITTRNLTDEDVNKDVLQSKLNRLLFITDGVVDTSIIDENMDIISKIVWLEILCEEYAYENKREVQHMRGMQYKLNRIYPNYMEKKYLLFNEYGNKAITDDEVKRMYRLKFKRVLDAIDTEGEYNFNEDYGCEYYKTFLEESADSILQSRYESFNNALEEAKVKKLNKPLK